MYYQKFDVFTVCATDFMKKLTIYYSLAFPYLGIVKYLDLFIKMWYNNTAKPT